MAANGPLPSGSYTVNSENGQKFQIFCQFYSGYGYTFISNSTDVDVDVTSLTDDTSHVVIRHKRVNGLQYTSTIEQLDIYAHIPIHIQYNGHSGYQAPQNTQMTPYIFVGFIPEALITRGGVQGWKVNGKELTFTNCDGNPNSYFAFLFDHNATGYIKTSKKFNLLLFDWYSSASKLGNTEYLPDEFFTSQYEIHKGGCGGYSTSDATEDIAGVAVGLKFLITCTLPTAIIHGTNSYTDTRVGSVVTYTCDDGYVMIRGDPSLTCHVDGRWLGIVPTCKEPTNVALGKQAYQTDTYCCGPREAGLAVDGGLSQNWADGSCSLTETKADSYWEVDLGDVYEVDHVTIFSRNDSCCDDHLRHVEVYVGVTRASYQLVGFHDAAINDMQTFQIEQSKHARWIKITRRSDVDEQLSLCEVQVMGYKPTSNVSTQCQAEAKTKGAGDVIGMYLLSSEIDCCRKCLRLPGCVAVNFDLSTRLCYLLESVVQTATAYNDVVFLRPIQKY